jgi:aldose 1-epimerase
MKKISSGIAAVLGAAIAFPGAAEAAASATRSAFGQLSDGSAVEAVVLKNDAGISATVITYGATLQSVIAPDRENKPADIVLGYDDLAGFVEHPNYFGVTVGRYANRIGGGRFTLDGKTYQLPQNDGENSLHGGTAGFDKRNWRIVSVKQGKSASVTMELVSAAGDQGYPGTLTTRVKYELDSSGDLVIDFTAATDAPTIVNMTNHAIFNLSGEGGARDALDMQLTIPASRFTPVNDKLIPTGELRPVAGTPFDFTQGRVLAQSVRDGTDPQIVIGRGYDHNFVLDAGLTAEPKLAAKLVDPISGRVLEVLTTEPGIQLYTGNFLDGTLVGKKGHVYRMGDGVALEPQKFPDTPNKPAFGSARVDPGKPYHHRMIYRFSVVK